MNALCTYYPNRTVIPKPRYLYTLSWYGAMLTAQMTCAFFRCTNLQTIKISTETDPDFRWKSTNLANIFNGNSSLTKILNVINTEGATSMVNMFAGCTSLVEVRLHNLKKDVSFNGSHLLSKESLLYMIENCSSSATFTITLHPNVYAKCQEGGEWYSEVSTALSAAQSGKTTTITLASA